MTTPCYFRFRHWILLGLIFTLLFSYCFSHAVARPSRPSAMGRNFHRGYEAITRQNAEASLRFLASGAMRGRLAGSVEGHITARYIISELEQMGYDSSQLTAQPFVGKRGESLTNILVTITGSDSSERVIVGAHFDHNGTRNGVIYPGADDNASGTVVLLELARSVKAAVAQPDKTLILAFWDGEERGLLGSRYYTKQIRDTSSVLYYINFDMVGRNTDESRPHLFRYFYTESEPDLRKWIDESIRVGRLSNLEPDYRPCDRTIGGSDNTPFARMGIPIVWYHTDGHPDYNKPTDTADKINYPKLLDITRSAWYLIWRMSY